MNNLKRCIGVTGSTGFIGKHVVADLVARGYDVCPLEGDLLETDHIASYFRKTHVNCLVHLLATSRLPFAHMLEKNVRITEHILSVGVPLGLKKIVYTSTGIVYGEGEKDRVFQEVDVPRPTSDYGITKLFAEQCITMASRTKNVEYVILRFSNVFGSGHYRGVLYDLLSSIEKNHIITVTGDGLQRRNFLHVSDAVRAIELAIQFEKNGVFNIGNKHAVTLNELVEILHKRYSFSVKKAPTDMTKPRGSGLDVTKARKLLQFETRYTLDDFLDSDRYEHSVHGV